ncbi:MAG: SDR family oxidoreductase [Hyphomonadaceae bacterium]|nr:SDR family oxidoreductase [Hyphomonadaceae bacterium]
MPGRLAGKKALITGGAQGLGAAIATHFVDEGASVFITDLNGDGARWQAEAINGTHPNMAQHAQQDVRSEARWKEVVQEAHDAMGGLNVLVNNAGIGTMGTVEAESFENWKLVQEVDVDSVFLGCKYALPLMKPHGRGSIINISSIAGLIASGYYPSYNAAKAAVWLLSKSVALHCAKVAPLIRCNSIHRSFIETPILDGMVALAGSQDAAYAKLGRQIPLGHIGEPSDVAWAAVYLASDESKFVTGSELKVDGGISAQ